MRMQSRLVRADSESNLGIMRRVVWPGICSVARGGVLLLAFLLLSAVSRPLTAQSPPSQATVYRDDHGMPHIEAQTEAAAWYALGYEQARDALLFIQIACRSARGELTWLFGPRGLTNDVAVKVSQSYSRLAAMSPAARRDFFTVDLGSPIQANFYDNCVAFAAGADAYREAVRTATPASPPAEWQLREWLRTTGIGFQNDSQWVYNTPIGPLDILAQGAWTAAIISFQWPLPVVNFHQGSYGIQSTSIAPVEWEEEPITDGLSGEQTRRLFEGMKEQVSNLPGAPSAFTGSNTFAWHGMYCMDPPPSSGHRTSYPGLLGDPHQGIPSWLPLFEVGVGLTPNHLWFAHIKVTPQGASQPILDCIGHVPHAAATFFTGHNRNIAMGGTMAGPNHFDQFLLRLRATPTGFPDTNPPAFYSYYADSASNPTHATYRSLVPWNFDITRPNGSTMSVRVWRAESFGVVLPTKASVEALYGHGTPILDPPVVHGERIDPAASVQPAWRAGSPMPANRQRFSAAPEFGSGNQLLTSPMVVALRQPMNPDVQGEAEHWHLLLDFWRIAHANSIMDVVPMTNGAAYNANICFVDRQGRTFSTQLGKIPRRGGAALAAAGYTAFDQYAIYSKGFGPVPARHYGDKIFDWNFGTSGTTAKPAPLQYLEYAPAFQFPPSGPFKARVWQDQSISASPPTRWFRGGTEVEGGFFTSATNDQTWGFSRKRDAWNWNTSNPIFSNNALLQWVVDQKVLYQTRGFSAEGPDRQQIIVSEFAKRAQFINSGGTSGSPPWTPAQMREFVVSPRLYHEPDYVPPPGIAGNPSLPPPVRLQQEVASNLWFSNETVFGDATSESPLVTATKELNFFADLWAELHRPNGGWRSHQVVASPQPRTVDLRDLWVGSSLNATSNEFFWYDDPGNQTGCNWFQLPGPFPLIDFYWPETEVSKGLRGHGTAGGLQGTGSLSSTEIASYGSLVGILTAAVGPQGFRMEPSSVGASLLEMTRQGYGAFGPDHGRRWMRLKNGFVEHQNPVSWSPLTTSGGLPASSLLRRQTMPWGALSEVAFPWGDLAGVSLFRRMGLRPPYEALYSTPATRTVHTTLSAQNCNRLVRFFLELGGHYVDPANNNGNPSRKLAKFELLGSEAKFIDSMPGTYPMTDGMIRLSAVRALLDADAWLRSLPGSGGSIPPFSQCFRARAYSYTGQVFPSPLPPPPPPAPAPPLQADVACFGGGLRDVVWNPDLDFASGGVIGRGLQGKFLGAGGSIATLLALFPDDPARAGQVDSYYWCTPGIQIMGHDPSSVGPWRFDAHMTAFASNVLLESRFDSYLQNISSTVVHTY